jgi:hypothetical protein
MFVNKTIELWPVEKLVPYIRNPRKNDSAVTRMVSSLSEFGFKIPMWCGAMARSSTGICG